MMATLIFMCSLFFVGLIIGLGLGGLAGAAKTGDAYQEGYHRGQLDAYELSAEVADCNHHSGRNTSWPY